MNRPCARKPPRPEEFPPARKLLRAALGLLLALSAGLTPFAPPASAQTLAHRGWVGSGMNVEPWWKSAVFYQLDPALFAGTLDRAQTPFAGVAAHLDYLKSLNVDALLLSPFHLQPTQAAETAANQQQDDFDTLLSEAGRRQLRIVIDLPLDRQPAATTSALARFWLGRGVAGLRLGWTRQQADAAGLSGPQVLALMRSLRKICAGYTGDRVLVWDSDQTYASLRDSAGPATQAAGGSRTPRPRTESAPLRTRRSATPDTRPDGPQIEVDHQLERLPALNAADLRAALLAEEINPAHAAPMPIAGTDASGLIRSFTRYAPAVSAEAQSAGVEQPLANAKILAAVLLTGKAHPLIYFGQELGLAQTAAIHWNAPASNAETAHDAQPVPTEDTVASEDADDDSLLNFYRRLASLRHASAALRDGSFKLLDTGTPDLIAWLRVGRTGASSRTPVIIVCNLSAHAEAARIDPGLRAAGIHTVAGSTLKVLARSGEEESRVGPENEPSLTIALGPYAVLVGEPTARATTLSLTPAHRHVRRKR